MARRSSLATTTARKYREITPEYLQALQAYSEILFKAGMGGKDCTRWEYIAAKIEVGRDVGLPVTQALAFVMIVNGKPTIWGDAALALIRGSGLLTDGYPQEWYEGTEGEDDFTAYFRIKRAGKGAERTSAFSIADAKRANLWNKKGPWTEYPFRQLMWRAKGWGCRDEFPDVLCGLTLTEEALDLPSVKVIEASPAPSLPPHEVIKDAQLDRLVELRERLVSTVEGEEEKNVFWQRTLAFYGIKNGCLQLDSDSAAILITKLESYLFDRETKAVNPHAKEGK